MVCITIISVPGGRALGFFDSAPRKTTSYGLGSERLGQTAGHPKEQPVEYRCKYCGSGFTMRLEDIPFTCPNCGGDLQQLGHDSNRW